MKSVFAGLILALFIYPFTSFSQKGFSIGAPSAWIEKQTFSTEISDSADVSGYYYLLSDFQENAEERESYTHTAIKVVNDQGLSYVSSWDWSYDPAFERIVFHSLYILRGTQKIDHLSRKNFEIIQREENLSRASYDGSLSVIINLKDVKASDIVVFSYSRKGRNPVFKDHYFRTIYFNFRSPMAKITGRLVADRKRNIQFKNFGEMPPMNEVEKGSRKVYTWQVENVPATPDEDQLPSWYSPSNKVQISDFKGWNEFSEWTVDLFNVDKKKSRALTKFIDSLKSIPDEETRLLTAVKTVQEKIRYFSFVDGMSAYRPHNPSSVFDNKYGDCKDKALLLSEILNAIGIESHPLLVSTEVGPVMFDKLPSPWNFNHSIAQYKYKDSTYYIDATITSQRGTAKNIVTPDYDFGVIADPGQPGLTKIASTRNRSLIRAKEDFEVLDVTGSARLKVETYYSGSEADNVRDGFQSKTKAEMNKTYVDFYANEYPEIKLIKSVSFSDDTVANTVTVFEEYEIPKFWKYDSTRSKYVAETYARVISSYINRPSTKVRHAPFTIRYPLDLELITNIHVPEEWSITTNSKKISGPSFNFTSNYNYADKVIRLEFALHHTHKTVDASNTVEFLDKIDKVYNELGFEITHTGETDTQTITTTTDTDQSNNGKTALLMIVYSVIFYFASKRMYYFDPRSRQLGERYDRIEGWLILAAFGLTIWPLTTLYHLVMDVPTYASIFIESATFVQVIVLMSSMVLRVTLLSILILSAILFWNRRTSTPYFVVVAYGFNLLIVSLDTITTVLVNDQKLGSDMETRIAYAIILPVIWVPAFLTSERARGTFTQRLGKKRE
jgi:hypothetical protein